MASDVLKRLIASAREASPLGTLADDQADLSLCIVAPSHPWLCSWIVDALGLTPGDAVMVTLPGGASRSETGDLEPMVVRGVATACFRYGCQEVLLLALPSDMSPGDSGALVDAFRSRGVQRDSLPSADLRGYLGFVDDPQGWLPRAAADLRAAGAIPEDVLVHTAILDPRIGRLQVLESQRAERPDRLGATGPGGLGGSGPVALANASLLPLEQRSELDAAHHRASQPTQHVVDLKTLDHSHREAALAPAHSSLPVGSVVTMEPMAPGPSSLSSPSVVVGEALAAVPVSPRSLAPRPPPASATRSRRVPAPRPPPAPSRRGHESREVVDLDAREIRIGSHHLDPELAQALRVVRDFYRANFDEDDRAKMLSAATEALGSGVGIDVGLRVVIQPVIRLGPVRYQVLNELLAVKGGLAKLPVKVALLLLRALLT